MKAIRIYEFGEPEVMKIVEVERPVPMADEIMIKVFAASVNPADYIIRRGGNKGLKPVHQQLNDRTSIVVGGLCCVGSYLTQTTAKPEKSRST